MAAERYYEPSVQHGTPTRPVDAGVHDRGVLAEWFMRLRLDQELERSHRAGHLLSVVLLAPIADRNTVPDNAIVGAAAAVSNSARRADLVGWFDGDIVLALLPDGDELGSREAAMRWTKLIWLKTMHLGGGKWAAFALTNAGTFDTADAVLDAARAGLRATRPCSVRPGAL